MANAHAAQGSHDQDTYFVPHSSKWPLFASVALFTTMVGFATWLNEVSSVPVQQALRHLQTAFGNFFAEPSPDVRLRRVGKAWHVGKVLFELCDLGHGLSLPLFQILGVHLGLGQCEHSLLELALLLR